MAVGELDLIVLDGAFVGFDRACILGNGFFLVFDNLACDGVAGKSCLVAGQIHPGLIEDSLVMLQRSFSLGERGLRGTGVDIDERIALADGLAFAIMHLHYAAGDLAIERNRVGGGNGTEGLDVDVDVAGLGLADGDGRGTILAAALATASASIACSCFAGGIAAVMMDQKDYEHQKADAEDPEPRAPWMLQRRLVVLFK